MEKIISNILSSSAQLKQRLSADAPFVSSIKAAATRLSATLKQGGTVYACGNGGSACDAMHLVEELVARYKRDRPGLRAMHFQDSAVMSCWSNDYEYQSVFERQAGVFCGPQDTLIGISTSGNSANVLRAVATAKAKGSFTLGLCGRDGGKLKSACDIALVVPAQETERIQEVHITLIHIFCELLETELKAF